VFPDLIWFGCRGILDVKAAPEETAAERLARR